MARPANTGVRMDALRSQTGPDLLLLLSQAPDFELTLINFGFRSTVQLA